MIRRARLLDLLRSAGLRHGMIMTLATFIAGGLDYGFNVLVGRLLLPTEYGIFIAVTALLQILVHLTNSIRNVVAYYTAEIAAGEEPLAQAGLFIRRSWRWAWRAGILALALSLLISPLLIRLLQLPGVLPLLAGSAAVLFLFLRPVSDGALQGLQLFGGLGAVQVLQALLRLILAGLLIWLGWQSFGALLALPIAMAGALLFALWLLRPHLRAPRPAKAAAAAVSRNYSAITLLGLLAFALIINLDAIVVKRVFSPELAGQYGPVVTLGKMNLFLPLALGLVLFPKVTQRLATGRNPRPLLLLALAATLMPGLALSSLYALAPGLLVTTLFGAAYADPGAVLPLVGLATTLYAGINIWLNFALSASRRPFIYLLALVFIFQATTMTVFHETLYQIALVMVATGLVGNAAGLITLFGRSP